MSHIEWCKHTWNPITGCTRVSAGCDNCYAARMTKRLEAMGTLGYDGLVRNGHFNGVVRCHEDRLAKPLGWKKPCRIFVNSMSDLFHERVPFDFIDQVFAMMALCPQHTFQVLTKRPERMAEYLSCDRGPYKFECAATDSRSWIDLARDGRVPYGDHWAHKHRLLDMPWPLPNVWLGTSCENQPTFDTRVGELLKCNAAVRFLSLEPLLGPIDTRLEKLGLCTKCGWSGSIAEVSAHATCPYELIAFSSIDWVIVGGESGPKCRPMDPDWAIDIVKQCQAAGVPVFVKQLGGFPSARKDMTQWPLALRVREYPG